MPSHADSSTLDTTCNTTGTRTDPLGNVDSANAVARQSNGKLIVAGTSDAAGSNDVVLIRYNTDCSVDSTFGDVDSIVGLHMVRLDASGAGLNDGANGVAVQSDGKIVVVGSRANGTNDDVLVVRLTSTGALDDTLDGDGIAVLDAGGNDVAAGVAIQSNGKIVVAGYTDQAGNDDSLFARFNTGGSADNTFDGNGWRSYNNGGSTNADRLTGVALKSNGNLVASGWANNGSDDDLMVFSTTTNGTPDAGFGSSGVYFDGASSQERATGVVIDGTGRIFFSGWTDFGGSNDFYVERVSAAGAFDGASEFVDFASGSDDQAMGLAFTPDGGVVLVGRTASDFGIAKLTSDLNLDGAFNGSGITTTDFSGGSDMANAVLVQPDGRIVAVGLTSSGPPDLALARYQGSPLMRFSASAYSVNENVGNATITVLRNGATQDAVTVHVATSNGTATAGSDYTARSLDLNFTAGQTSKTFTVPIANDTTKEAPETINLTLSAPGGTGDAVLGSPSTAVLTIRKSDQRVDGLIKYTSDASYLGNNVYNATGASQTRGVNGARGSKKVFYARIQNDGNVVNAVTVKGAAAPSGFSVRYFAGTTSTSITSAVRAGTYSTGNLAVGAYKLIRIEITVGSSTASGTVATIPVTGKWTGDGTRTDVVRARVTVS